MTKSTGNSKESPANPPTITTLSVAGFKSISGEQTIEVRPLTLLAGANSSGKSSMMQPLLLLKQTLEAPYDPGPLLLNGPNAKFTAVGQFWPLSSGHGESTQFVVTVGASNEGKFGVAFHWDNKKQLFEVSYNLCHLKAKVFKISAHTAIIDNLDEYIRDLRDNLGPETFKLIEQRINFSKPAIRRSKFFLETVFLMREPTPGDGGIAIPSGFPPKSEPFEAIVNRIMEVIHLPGLRGNPERTYPVTAIGPRFPGTFENYVASLVAHWSSESSAKIEELSNDLKLLGLTWKIEAKRVDDTRVELQVGRLLRPKQGGAKDLVSIADVGFGVSQTLPVVVALRAARPGQLVYIEQPEIHLHPRAQVAMARLLVNAAKRGVRVVAETHSSLLLLAVQILVAEGEIDPALVGLNWFHRNEKNGTTRIQKADLDEAGRYGEWPEDFDEVALKAESRYLSAAEARLAGR